MSQEPLTREAFPDECFSVKEKNARFAVLLWLYNNTINIL